MDRSRRRTRKVYDAIAEHFAETRAYPWPEVEEFLSDAQEGDVGIDVGCGNGRHVEPLARRVERAVGLDASSELLQLARERLATAGVDAELVVADAARVPLATDSVAIGVYVATIHHLPDRESRRESLNELARVLAPGGEGLVSAWSIAHDRFDRDAGFDTTIDWTLPDGETVPRFYHVYDPVEFDRDLEASDLRIRESFVSSGNCYARVTPDD